MNVNVKIFFIILMISSSASGTTILGDVFQAYYPTSNSWSNFQCVICHSVGDLRNPYGQAFENNGANNGALNAIRAMDSDGDGYTNEDEILAGSNPGDPNSDVTNVPAPNTGGGNNGSFGQDSTSFETDSENANMLGNTSCSADMQRNSIPTTEIPSILFFILILSAPMMVLLGLKSEVTQTS